MAFQYKHGDQPLEGFTIQRGVGRGGFGEVYYAVSDAGKEVALKYLRDNPQVELRGVTHCMNLKSPHLVTIFDVRTNPENDTFIVMEYVHGPSLRDLLIAEPKGLGMQKAAYFTREIAKGLGYLHDRGIVHRDLKPGNIFYEDGYVKIGDYGLSKYISVSRHSGQTASVGTVHYMAPEVGSGNYHRGIDIYSLGVILYEMMCGRVPFEGSTLGEVLMKHLMEQPDVQEMPAPFADVIRKALAKDPKDRYQRVEEMIADLFEVEDVERSVAGFEPGSLSTAARHVEIRTPTPPPPPPPSPVPDAGPARPQTPSIPPEVAPDQWEKYADAMEEWGRRFGDHMHEWGANYSRQVADKARHAAGKVRAIGDRLEQKFPAGARMDTLAGRAPTRGQRIQRLLVAGVVTAALSFGAAVLADEFGAAPLVFGAIGGIGAAVFVAERLCLGMAGLGENSLLRRLVVMGCAAPVVWVGGLIYFEAFRVRNASFVALAALIATGLIDWSKRIQRGMWGRVDLHDAVRAGLAGAIIGAILAGDAALVIGAITASISMIVQTVASVFIRPSMYAGATSAPTAAAGNPPRHDSPETTRSSVPPPPTPPPPHNFRMADVDFPGVTPEPRRKSGFVRVFWAFLAACMVSASAICFLAIGFLTRINRDTEALLVCGGVGLGTLALFPVWLGISSTRKGFWMGFLRPLIVCGGLAVGAVGACALGFVDEFHLRNEEVLVPVSMMVAGPIFAFFFLLLGLRPNRKPLMIVGRHLPGEFQ